MKFCIDTPTLEIVGYPVVLYVDKNSDTSLKNHLASFALYFKKEMRFDGLQFDESMYDNDDFTGFLVLQRAFDLVEREDHYPSRIVGAGVFARNTGLFELDWVWIHPFSRNRGTLKGLWEGFQNQFGKFTVSEPLSAQMSAFLKKRD